MASAQLAPSFSPNLRNPILDRARDADPLLSYYKRRNSVHNINYKHSIHPCSTTSQPVAMSSSHDPSFMRQAASIGAMNYLVKPISAETVHSLWLNVFSCRTHNQTTAAVAAAPAASPAAAAAARISMNGLAIDDRTLLVQNESCGDTSTLSPQQSIFQRRIRTDTVNGT
ncbi:hypothetical protein GGI22_007670, partial [Coemansia erecta]